MKTIIGDVRKLATLREAMTGVDTVIHTAGVVSFGTFPDLISMEEVNVKGTGRPPSGLEIVTIITITGVTTSTFTIST